MAVWARALLGLAGLVAFAAFAVADARALAARRGAPVAWVLMATCATILAGFAHLALTPAHWEESAVYGLFFLAAGLVQLLLAAAMGRTAGDRLWPAVVVVNLALVGVYVATRVVPPPGADVPEAVDAIGVVTVVAEVVAAAAGAVVSRRLAGGVVSPPR